MRNTTKKPVPPLIEGWIRELRDPNTNLHIKENYARELQHIVDMASEALRSFNLDRNRTIDTQLESKRRRKRG